MTPEQKSKIRALERLKQRGILKDAQLQQIEQRNEKTSKTNGIVPKESTSGSEAVNIIPTEPFEDQSRTEVQNAVVDGQWSTNNETEKRPLERIKPSIHTKDYIEYDFSTMRNLNGGYINPEDRNYSFDDDNDDLGNKKQKTLDDWKREQQERKHIYENAPPPEHISKAPKCIECKVNIEMDPVMDDVFKLRVCKSCVKEHPEKFSMLTKTECKEDYFLTDPELNDSDLFHKLEKPNPHSGTFARMQLFVRCEVEEFAFKKWGGEEGLDKEWHRREEGKSQRREKKYQQEMLKMRMKTRAQEYTTRLKERKHGKAHVHSFTAPIDGGMNEDGHQVLRRRCVDCGMETEEVDI
ncbi:DNA repair protein RAD14 TDEL_0A07100 [Torulaspora delbrueckii]|uniref:DNA repair protein RAD14 n=1 Tax=Torulaspora delbrueckii TaxID=4950 RepID=G8ZN48_TORDE|nr:hypothetical protein TDEL_0A07100 [Torulaspora delbrueckii]CCE90042.1 hypothetical protein TDEL_0A07100 [Torulaspora delbrueckii]